MTAPNGTTEDTCRVTLSSVVMEKMGADAATNPAETSKASDRKIREMPMKKVSRVFDIQKNIQFKNNFT